MTDDALGALLRRQHAADIERQAPIIGTDADVPDNAAAWSCELDRREAERRSGVDRRVTVREAHERRQRDG